ncbi:hypothetical protein AAG570_009145 [Ranatra chinensis]|uniref:C2H2-type domain-containing protein n=1 Tax=Ranatra chinensis TaxID=642074 RepID=A0ABD0YV32_9HEMI
MAPDDSAKKRQQRQELKQQLRLVTTASLMPGEKPGAEIPPLGLLMPSVKHLFAKSAFTKVTTGGRAELPPAASSPSSSTVSGGAVSPDNFRDSRISPPPVHSHYLGKVQEDKSAACKGKIYPGEVLPYGGLAVPYPFVTLLTAAANVTAAAAAAAALLPPSLAALTLPAQNVCAKCNVSFRMTSDLVYHMRSHHKNDTLSVDSARRRREQDKLRCPVCNESFRERHHLTRHMTAHQDKEGDSVDEEDETPRRRPQAPAK